MEAEQSEVQIDTGSKVEDEPVGEFVLESQEKQTDEIDDLVNASETFQEALQKRRSDDSN